MAWLGWAWLGTARQNYLIKWKFFEKIHSEAWHGAAGRGEVRHGMEKIKGGINETTAIENRKS